MTYDLRCEVSGVSGGGQLDHLAARLSGQSRGCEFISSRGSFTELPTLISGLVWTLVLSGSHPSEQPPPKFGNERQKK